MLRRINPPSWAARMTALAFARANITAWLAEADRDGLDAILVTTSGCGTVIKDYGFMLREDRDFAASAAKVSALAKDITEYVSGSNLRRNSATTTSSSLITRLVRFNTGRKSRNCRKNCFPRTDSW